MYDDENPQAPQKSAQWAVPPGTRMFQPSFPTVAKLPDAIFKCQFDGYGQPQIVQHDIVSDDLIDFSDGEAAKLVGQLDRFWNSKAVFEQHGIMHRRGILLYGPQGCGKTSIALQLANKSVQAGRVVFLSDNVSLLVSCIEMFRQIEPNRQLMAILEDLDSLVSRDDENQALLQWLDGNNRTDNIVVLATTNYPERLDKRVIARPRRFDRLVYVDYPSETQRLHYFQAKLKGYSEPELSAFATATNGLSFASLTDVIVSVVCLGNELVETTDLLRKLENGKLVKRGFMDDLHDDEYPEYQEYDDGLGDEDEDDYYNEPRYSSTHPEHR